MITAAQESQLNALVARLPPGNYWLAGGAVLRVLEGNTEHADVDLFFHDGDAAREYEDALLGADFTKLADAPPTYKRGAETVQCINFKFYDSMREVLESFDISVCKVGFEGGKLVADAEVLDDIRTKRPRFCALVNAPATLLRVVKYSKRGYVFTRESLKDLVEKIRDGEDQEGMSG